MKNILFCTIILTLTACSQTATEPMKATVTPTPQPAKTTISKADINGQWRLAHHLSGKDNQSLLVEFDDNKVIVLNGCNQMQASYQMTGNTITMQSLVSTRMACDPKLMAIDNLASQLFKQTWQLSATAEKLLLTTTIDDTTYQFSKGR